MRAANSASLVKGTGRTAPARNGNGELTHAHAVRFYESDDFLLSNAVKFTERGGRVELSCEAEQGVVKVHVRDTGLGIPPDKLDAIFGPVVQVRADLTRPHEGTGLGLAISRDLARGMGGDLTATSRMGSGSTFTLVLPSRDGVRLRGRPDAGVVVLSSRELGDLRDSRP